MNLRGVEDIAAASRQLGLWLSWTETGSKVFGWPEAVRLPCGTLLQLAGTVKRLSYGPTVSPLALLRGGARLTRRVRVSFIAAALAALVLVVACDNGGSAPAVTRVVQWPDNWPVPPLPVMSLEHEAGPIQGDPHAYCWQFEGAPDRVCEEEDIWSGSYEYPEVASNQRIPIMIDAETSPTKLFAQVYTKPGNLMVDGLRRLSTVNPKLDLNLSPGEYNVRLIGYWQDNEISYEFGLFVPGEAALIGGC